MNKRILMVTSIAILSVLASSMIAASQAWQKPKSEFVGYDAKFVFGEATITSFDTSHAPYLIIFERANDGILEGNITIGDEVYYYPDNFSIATSSHLEYNSLTGTGLVRVEGTITFMIPGNPTLKFHALFRFSGLFHAPDGTIINPQDFKGEGQYELIGTKRFRKVDGFGISDNVFAPPDYENNFSHQFGYIKGWPL